ncbi:MAG TPA: endo-1,4-beta-xylanase [Stellaceae bacterium]|nr:endo-1,4-beta-xylanase [Stellaceae bacterium]
MIARRDLLLAGAALPLLPKPALAAPPLRDIAASRGLVYGTYVRSEMLDKDRMYTGLVTREAGLIVCSCAHWKHLAPTRTTVDYTGLEAAYGWARAHRMQYRGHALLWGEAAPVWFAELPDRAAAIRAVEEHVTGTCRHFAGRFHSWDVVNEPLKLGDGRADHLRRSVFAEKIGPDYLDIAFRAARAADPKTRLVLNEFGVELETENDRDKRAALLGLIDGFKKRGTPIDAVGIQSHIATATIDKFDPKAFGAFLAELAGRGLEIMLTELDVVDKGAPAAIPARDRAVADTYRRYLDAALASPAVTTVVNWGLSDINSWISSGKTPEAQRADGLEPRPLPFDKEGKPKPAYAAIAAALGAAPLRRQGARA